MWHLFLAEFKRNMLEFFRYPGEVVASVIVLVIMFYALFLGAGYIAGPAINAGGKLDSIIIGYIVWAMALYGSLSISNEIQKDAQTGALQQVFLSAYGPTIVFAFRAVSAIVLNFVITVLVLFAIMFITGRWLDFSLSIVGPVVSVMLGIFGIAFLMGGVALRFKRVQQVINFIQFILLFLIVTPLEELGRGWVVVQGLLPVTPGASLLRDVMARGDGVDWYTLMLACVNGAVYAVAGMLVFYLTINRVKRSGALGWY